MPTQKKAKVPPAVADDRKLQVLRSIDSKLGQLVEYSVRLEKRDEEIVKTLRDIAVHTGMQTKISGMILAELQKDKTGTALDEARRMAERDEGVGEGSGHQDVMMDTEPQQQQQGGPEDTRDDGQPKVGAEADQTEAEHTGMEEGEIEETEGGTARAPEEVAVAQSELATKL